MADNNFNSIHYNLKSRQYHFQVSTELRLAALEKKIPEFLSPHPLVQTSGRQPDEPLLGIIANWQSKPVGLVLMEKHGIKSGLLICWHVLETHRGFGLGQKLMWQLERYAKYRKIESLILSFRGDSRFQRPISKILHQLNWSPPKKELMLYKFSVKQFMKLTWYQNIKLPKEFEIFSWDTLTNIDKQHILNRQQHTHWYPLELSPTFENPDFETTNSLGLRLHGNVVGWLITHQVHANVIEYCNLFVSPELQSTGLGYHLIVEAIKRQNALGVEYGIFQVQVGYKTMLSFVQRRMDGTIVAQTGRCFSKKVL